MKAHVCVGETDKSMEILGLSLSWKQRYQLWMNPDFFFLSSILMAVLLKLCNYKLIQTTLIFYL